MPLFGSRAVDTMDIPVDLETQWLTQALERTPSPMNVIPTHFSYNFASILLYGGKLEFRDDGNVFRSINDFQEELLTFAITSDAVFELFLNLKPLMTAFRDFAKSKKRGTRFHS
jgi:hypothetical protein